ncbi:WD40 repeat domain-containing protein [Streptomyces sp. T21Q-yed]|uniref:WD40 repeat domain-containing protein n=1 Tax=unclassified Streptomyces TaxID=2593676 RepID=UPI0031FC9D49
MTRVLERTDSRRLLLVIDQCEEALTAASADVAALTDVLSVENLPESLRILITLRADFLEPALAAPWLGPLVGHRIHALRPMNREQLREVITAPIAATPNVTYDEGLDDRILKDTGDAPGALPLLVMALDLLWREQTVHGRLTYEAYERIEGVTGALSREAERAWANTVTEADEPNARRLFTRLVQIPVAGSGAVARRPAARSEFAPAEWEIAQRLAATRLLVTGQGDTVELAHEALITGWPKLAAWVAEDHEFLAWRETVRLDLDRWRGAGEPAELLPSAVALATAQRWLTERADDIGDAERDFLERGHRRRRSAVRRRRGLFSAIGLITAAALVLGALFFYQRAVSEEQEAAANSRALASISTDQRLQDPALAIQLALAAYRTSPTDEAKNALLRYYAQYRSASRILSGTLGAVEDFRASEDGDVMLARTDTGRATLFVHAMGGTVRTEQLNGPPYVVYPLVSGDGGRVGYMAGRSLVWYDVRPGGHSLAGDHHQLPVEGPEFEAGTTDSEFAQLSADGRLLAAAGGTSVAWWDVDRRAFGGRITVPQARGGQLKRLWFGPDDDTLIALAVMADAKQRLLVIDRRTGSVRVLADSFEEAVVSGDGSSAVTCRSEQGGDRTAVYTGVRTSDGSRLGQFVNVDSSLCTPIALGPGGRYLALGSGTRKLVDLRLSMVTATFREPDESGAKLLSYARLVGEGSKLLLVTGNSTGIFCAEVATSPAQDMHRVDLTPDGRRVVALPSGGESIQLRTVGTSSEVIAQAPRIKPYWEGEDLTVFTKDGTLLAERAGVNKVAVRDAKSLRQVSVVTTVMPPEPVSDGHQPLLDYFFDHTGRLVTATGTMIQRWDSRTGRAVDDYDLNALGRVVTEQDVTRRNIKVSSYPAADRVSVVVTGDPYLRVIDLPSGRQTVRYDTNHNDNIAATFDPSGEHFALLRRSRNIELWDTDPLGRKIGPLPSFDFPAAAGFVTGEGRYMLAANNKIRIYRLGKRSYEASLDLGPYSERNVETPKYYFLDATPDGETLLYYRAGVSSVIYPLSLRPDSWADALCRVLGGRDLTRAERDSQPVPVPSEPVCP